MPSRPQVFGFFHPYCSGGGGGERVLWKIVQVLQRHGKKVVIYTIDPSTTNEAALRRDAEERFDVTISDPIQLVSLEPYKDLLLPAPFLSMVVESWGTVQLAYHALRLYPKIDVFCDTTGCAFTFLVAKLIWNKPIVAYVHYPTISTDMIQWERQQRQGGALKTKLKLVYYRCFAVAYGMVGSLANLVLVNSTWTYNHIHNLWKFSKQQQIEIVYPPCRVQELHVGQNQKRMPTIVSIGQFRPEKNHRLQIEAVACLLQKHSTTKVKLLLIGGCRNDQDEQRVTELQDLVKALNLTDVVEFSINPPYKELKDAMTKASIGIHTMRQEHFGIGIVEMMSAGLITIAHNSGGPRSDIIQDGVTGFLSTTAEEYARAIHDVLTMNTSNAITMREKAQESAQRFSDSAFDESLEKTLKSLLQ